MSSPCPETDPSFDLSRQARDEQHKEGKESTHQKRGEQTFVFLQGSGIRVMAYSPLGSSADRYPVRTNQLQLQFPLSKSIAPFSHAIYMLKGQTLVKWLRENKGVCFFFFSATCIIIAPKRLKLRLSGSARKSQKRFRDTPRF
eukprot:COSAG06_NODE_16036_length_1027_cov_1.265086_1_plen_142_part_10